MDMNLIFIQEIQKKITFELEKHKSMQIEYGKVMFQRRRLDGDLNESEVILSELKLLKVDAPIYKKVGPVIVKQDLEESHQCIEIRIENIKEELSTINGLIVDMNKKREKHRETMQKLRLMLLQAKAKAGLKA